MLKKAVLDEQAKSAILQVRGCIFVSCAKFVQNSCLLFTADVASQDELQMKDQTIRKSDQEIDSLAFRNTQLEKRVGFLQEELAREIVSKH